MKKVALAAFAALTLSAVPGLAADLPVKAKPMVAAPPPAWDLAFGSAIASDYIFRGITQSNRKPSVSAYFEPRYNLNKDVQLYAGIAGASISFPNRAAAEIDLYGGIRPTFGKLALDIGAIYYWYPGGQCFHFNAAFGTDCGLNGALPLNGNVIKSDLSFWEVYGKATYTVNDNFSFGGSVYYSPSVLNSGANGTYVSGNAKLTGPTLANGVQPYVSAEVGYWMIGTSDSFYSIAGVPGAAGIDYADYTTWNIGVGWTWKVFTVDLRYYDTDLNKGNCNAFTSDHTATATGYATSINPGGIGSSWCGSAFVAKLSADLTVNTNIK